MTTKAKNKANHFSAIALGTAVFSMSLLAIEIRSIAWAGSGTTSYRDKYELAKKTATLVTVRLEGAGAQGSGVIVRRHDNTYTVLTAWHVLKSQNSGEELAIFTHDGKSHQHTKNSIRRIRGLDLAVVNFRAKEEYEIGEVRVKPRLATKEKLIAAGFPLKDGNTLDITEGKLIAYAQIGVGQGYQLLYTNATWPGMSGGPLIDKGGRIIGIHGRGERSERKSSQEEEVRKTGINQGVPIGLYLGHLSGAGKAEHNVMPSTAEDYLLMAFNAMSEYGTGQTVVRLATYARKLNNEQNLDIEAVALWLTGKGQAEMQRLDDAIQSFTNAIKLEPNLFVAWIDRGLVNEYAGKSKLALMDYDKAIQIAPDFPDGYERRGLLYAHGGEYGKARIDFTRVLRLEPNQFRHYVNRGIAALKMLEYEEACKDIKKADSLGSSYAHAILMKMQLMKEAQDYCSY